VMTLRYPAEACAECGAILNAHGVCVSCGSNRDMIAEMAGDILRRLQKETPAVADRASGRERGRHLIYIYKVYFQM